MNGFGLRQRATVAFFQRSRLGIQRIGCKASSCIKLTPADGVQMRRQFLNGTRPKKERLGFTTVTLTVTYAP